MKKVKKMGKRSDFERKPRDYYQTPIEAVLPLVSHLPQGGNHIAWGDKPWNYSEPCAGNGALVRHLSELTKGICLHATDIQPHAASVDVKDAFDTTNDDVDYIITNPPWDRKMLHPMIEHFSKQKPTWLLFDADWMHTKQSVEYTKYLHKIISVGRIKWFGNMTGKDNCAWYLFDYNATRNAPLFYGRT
jgi:hypothetical protein